MASRPARLALGAGRTIRQGNLDQLRRLPYARFWLWMMVVAVLLLHRGTAGRR